MHHIISHHWSVHGVASSSSRKCGLTNGYARVELRVAFGFLNLSCHCWHYWVATLDFLWWCFSHITMMPRWNLGPHVRCSHMIEPLGAHWCQGICDITHCNPLLCNLTSVLTIRTSLKSVRLTRFSSERVGTGYVSCASSTHMCVHHTHASQGEYHTRALSSLHHGVCIIGSASWQLHRVICTISSIILLYQHCNHTSQECIIIMVIEHLPTELEYFVIIPWLHWHK